jgi:hypothetical protein
VRSFDPLGFWLQIAVSTPHPGTDVHHIVEQSPARADGLPDEMIEGPENRVRISRLKHWEITRWYATRNRDFGGQSPRDFLRGKDWHTRVRVGRERLIKEGILKP